MATEPAPPPLVILDRDGVINEDSDHYIRSPEEWIPIPGSIEAIARLAKAGYRIAVATNQSGLARGYFDAATLAAMHKKMHSLVEAAGGRIDYVAVCPHGPDDACTCRKPAPGLIREIGEHFGRELAGVPAIGDSLRDLLAAEALGCAPILVRTGKGLSTLRAHGPQLRDLPVYDDLAAAVDDLVKTH